MMLSESERARDVELRTITISLYNTSGLQFLNKDMAFLGVGKEFKVAMGSRDGHDTFDLLLRMESRAGTTTLTPDQSTFLYLN